jgi:hypothetical protein
MQHNIITGFIEEDKMHRKPFVISIVVIVLTGLLGCGPSPEAVATMTAEAWTPTPVPPTSTPTPTPIPYGLNVKVMDADGNPIPDATVVLAELGEGAMGTKFSDEDGTLIWEDLPGENATLSIAAQGYMPAESTNTMERGPNEVTVTLEADPFGLLPSAACAPDETVLMVEDFQDGRAQGWNEITAALDFNAQNGWALVEEEPGNIVLTASQSAGFATDSYQSEGMQPFENAVWRLRTKFTGQDNDAFLNWRNGWNDSGDWRYIVQYGGPVLLDLSRLHYEAGHFSVGRTQFGFREDQWYFIEIGTFGDTTQLWVDGSMKASYTDPQLMDPGTIGLEVHLGEGSNSVYTYDDIVVCGIESPFQTLYVSE